MFVFHSFYAACVWVEESANGPVGVLHSDRREVLYPDWEFIPITVCAVVPTVGTMVRREVLYPDWKSTRF